MRDRPSCAARPWLSGCRHQVAGVAGTKVKENPMTLKKLASLIAIIAAMGAASASPALATTATTNSLSQPASEPIAAATTTTVTVRFNKAGK